MSSMMELMFPSAPPQSGADRSHYGGALESTACYQHGDQTALNRGQGHVGRTLQAGNKDRAIKLPSPVSLTISVKKLGQRVAMKDESRNRFGHGEREAAHEVLAEGQHTFDFEPQCTIYSMKLAVMEANGLVGALVVMKWQAVLRLDGQILSDICSLEDYAAHVLNGEWDCVLQEKHELLVLDNGCT